MSRTTTAERVITASALLQGVCMSYGATVILLYTMKNITQELNAVIGIITIIISIIGLHFIENASIRKAVIEKGIPIIIIVSIIDACAELSVLFSPSYRAVANSISEGLLIVVWPVLTKDAQFKIWNNRDELLRIDAKKNKNMQIGALIGTALAAIDMGIYPGVMSMVIINVSYAISGVWIMRLSR